MNAFKSRYWNILQAAAWVLLRDPELVEKAAKDGQEGRSMALDLENALACQPCDFKSCRNAEIDIKEALQDSRLFGWGLANGRGDFRRIDPIQWADLAFHLDERGPPFVASHDYPRPGATKWERVKFSRASVIELWPHPIVEALRPKPAELMLPMLAPVDDAATATDTDMATNTTNRGRPSKYDNEAFASACLAELENQGIPYPANLDESWRQKSHLKNAMAIWCEDNWGMQNKPSDEWIRLRVNEAIKVFEANPRDQKNK